MGRVGCIGYVLGFGSGTVGFGAGFGTSGQASSGGGQTPGTFPLTLSTKLFVAVHGQSNASGSNGTPTLSSASNTFGNEQVDNLAGYNTITNLHEFGQERINSGLCNWLSFRELNRRTITHNFALGGTAYTGLASGTTPYNNGIAGLRAVQSASVGQGSGSVAGVLVWVHGEQDEVTHASASQYRDYLTTLQSDWQRDFRLLTTQSQATVPIIYDQRANWSQNNSVSPSYRSVPQVHIGQYDAHISSSNCVLVGPSYHISMSLAGADLHHTSSGHRRNGEYFAKVVQRLAMSGTTWTPVRPSSIIASASTITLQLEGGVGPPYTVDTSSVTYRSFNGFTYGNDASATAPQITAVSQSAGNTFVISLTSTAHVGAQLSYGLYSAWKSNNGPAGPSDNAGGNVRDSDTTPSQQATDDPLRNWLVLFKRGFDSFTAGSEPTTGFAAPTKSYNFLGAGTGNGLTARDIPTELHGASKFLFSFWYRRSGNVAPGANEIFFSAQNSAAPIQQAFDCRSTGAGNLRLFIYTTVSGGNNFFTTTGAPLPTGSQWTNVIGFFSGSGTSADVIRVWVNGAFATGTLTVATTMPTTLPSGCATPLCFGGSSAGTFGNQFGPGQMSHVAFWANPDLASGSAPTVVTSIYNGGTPGDLTNIATVGTPNRWWSLDGTMVDSGSSLPHAHMYPLISGSFTGSHP